MSNQPTVTLNDGDAPAPASLNDETILIDGKGRRLRFKPLDILAEARLTRMVGAEGAMNVAYMMGYVIPAVSVAEIDGEAVPQPMTQRELDAAIQRLGREGLAAVMAHIQKFAGQDEQSAGEPAIKN